MTSSENPRKTGISLEGSFGGFAGFLEKKPQIFENVALEVRLIAKIARFESIRLLEPEGVSPFCNNTLDRWSDCQAIAASNSVVVIAQALRAWGREIVPTGSGSKGVAWFYPLIGEISDRIQG